MIKHNNFEIIKKEDYNTHGETKAFLLSSNAQKDIYIRKLIEKNRHYYSFYDDGTVEDFIRITNAIKTAINPDKIEYGGITDIVGFFEKDNIKIDMLHNEMYDENFLVINPTLYSNEKIEMVDKWAVMINDEINSKEKIVVDEEKKTK